MSETWPAGKFCKARKQHDCDYQNHPIVGEQCASVIVPGERYFDPSEANPLRAGGFGSYRYCLKVAHPGVPTEVSEQV